MVGLRWVEDKRVTGRSGCPKCGATLQARNLIPVLSYVIQGGKCHNCKVKISPLYPIVELTTAVAYLFIYLVYGLSIEFIIGIVFMTSVIVSGVTDYKTGYVLDKVVIPPALIILLLTLIFRYDTTTVYMHLIPSIIAFILLIIAVKLEKLGGGDVVIIAAEFLVLGVYYASIAMFVTSLITLVFMLILKKKQLPFIPFWVYGNIITYIIIYTHFI